MADNLLSFAEEVGKDIARLQGRFYEGVGSPEGKVAAPVGTSYVDSAATTGAIRWIKASGTGNTGWKVEYGDTGWRDISADISDRESGRILLRRIGDQVFLVADALKLTTTGSVPLPRLGSDFWPVSRVRGTWNEPLSADLAKGSYNISSSGFFNVYGVGTSGIVFSETYLTDRSWPTTLTGTPA